MRERKVRIGIDVGGTFTKAVAIDRDTYSIIGKYEVLTTHTAEEGVAKGVIDTFQGIMEKYQLDPNSVSFIAHSTTQATNAFLEGDVATVGIVGMGRGLDALKARLDTRIPEIPLAPGRRLKTHHIFIDTTNNFSRDKANKAVEQLVNNSVNVVVASEAFSVDDPSNELEVIKAANAIGLPGTGGHEISKLYGLNVRTRTAVMNASIVPKMMETADMTENSIRKTGIKSPIMIMRGDGGLMNIAQMRKRPIHAMLSGPAASVAGCLMYLQVTDGVYFEVGGTSTNIGVIQNGRPMIKHVKLGGHSTFLPSLDVRVLGIAGGSMPRLRGKQIEDVGPRSAHIAALPYASFTPTEKIVDPKVVLIQPRPGDPYDYVALELPSGKKIAVTATCAANALGLIEPSEYAHGNSESAKKALEAVAGYLDLSMEETARRILVIATDKIIPVVEDLIKDYDLDRKTVWLVGGGGGAAALIPFASQRMKIDYKISDNAEVISSIGVALAMVYDVIERTMINPTTQNILQVRREAEEAAIRSGATPESVEVTIEIDGHKKRVRAIAKGAIDMRTVDLCQKVSSEEKKEVAARFMHTSPSEVKKVAETSLLDVYMAKIKPGGILSFLKGTNKSIRIIDNRGTVRLALSKGIHVQTNIQQLAEDLKETIKHYSSYGDAGQIIPATFVLVGGRVLDYSKLQTLDQILSILNIDIAGVNPEDKAVIIHKV